MQDRGYLRTRAENHLSREAGPDPDPNPREAGPDPDPNPREAESGSYLASSSTAASSEGPLTTSPAGLDLSSVCFAVLKEERDIRTQGQQHA